MDNDEVILRSKRLTGSIECLELLKQYLIAHPEIRLEQLIWNLDQGQDFFYEEPGETLERWKSDQFMKIS